MTEFHDLDDREPPDPESFRDSVLARARRYSTRRRLQVAGLAAALGLAIGVLPLAFGEPGTGSTNVATNKTSPTTSEMQDAVGEDSNPTTSTVESAPPSTASTTTAPAPSPATTVQSQEPAIHDCHASDWDATATAARPSYAPGEPVTFRVEARNMSDKHCRHLPRVQQITIRDNDGTVVASWVSHRESGYTPRSSSTGQRGIAPGQVWMDAVTWDQRGACEGCEAWQQVAPGTYVFDPEWVFDVEAAVEVSR